MGMPKVPWMLLMGIAFVGFLAWTAFASAAGQTVGTPAFDPVGGYVGTWIATNPGETSPFLVLKLTEASGALTGTMSRFTVGGQRDGHIIFRPLAQPADQISNLKISDGEFSFHWVGDPPFHGGDVLFVAEGTDVAYINLPISEDEWDRIFLDNWGLGGASPAIALHREGTGSGQEVPGGASESSEEISARLINRAEFLYKYDYGLYAGYSSLLHSGELEKANFKIMPLDLHSETDPLPGYVIRLVVAQDGATYHLLILLKKPINGCREMLDSDQTGVLAYGFACA